MNGQNKLKVLIVDDNKYDQVFLTRAIEKYCECEIFIADNGKTGLDLTETQQPDLIFLDVSMPVMDGLTMLRKLKLNSINNYTPTVVAITNFTDSITITNFFSLGISDYLIKPINDLRIFNKLEKIFENVKMKFSTADL